MKNTSRIEKILFSLLILLLPAQIGKHFWPQTAFVRGIRIDYLSPTIFLTDILVISLIAIWVIRLDWNAVIKSLAKRKTFLYAALVFLIVSFNILISTSLSLTTYSWLRTAELTTLFFYLLSAPKNIINRLKNLLSMPVIYSSLIAIAQFMNQGSIGGILYWLGERRFTIATPGIAKTDNFGKLILRPYATFPHPNALAGFILISFVLFWPLMSAKRKKGKYTKPLLTITFILGSIALLLTFSLSGWIAAILLTILLTSLKYKRNLLPVAVVSLMILAGLITAFPPEKQSIKQRLATTKTALEMTKQSPLVGVGLGNFIPNLAKLDQGKQAFHSPFLYYQPVHNIYLLLTAETGLIGLALFLWLITATAKRAKTKNRTKVTFALLGILLIGLVDHYWLTLQQTRLLFTIVLALAWRNRT